MKERIEFLPLDKINVLNPRKREPRKFAEIVESIRLVGLKKPIKVSHNGSGGATYDLVYGQGRLEACRALGHDHIPAIVVDISKEDRLLMSLVENLARRFPRASDVMREIQRLVAAGDSQKEISRKLGIGVSTISGYLMLSKTGEERLLEAVLKNQVPVNIAMEIARTGDLDSQRALLSAYEKQEINQISLRTIRKVIEQRRLLGKSLSSSGKRDSKTTAETMILALRRDADRKKAIVRKARLCDNRLLYITAALRKLTGDEDFRNLLRAEKLTTLPDFLAERLTSKLPEAA